MSPSETMKGAQQRQATASTRFAQAVSSPPPEDEGTASQPPRSVASPHSDNITEYFSQFSGGSDDEGKEDELTKKRKELAGFVETVKACGPEFAEVFGVEVNTTTSVSDRPLVCLC
jgi:hypothetical protein